MVLFYGLPEVKQIQRFQGAKRIGKSGMLLRQQFNGAFCQQLPKAG